MPFKAAHVENNKSFFAVGVLTAEILSEGTIQFAFHSAGKISVVLSSV